MRQLGHTVGPLSEAEDLLRSEDGAESLRRALTAGLFMNAAVRQQDGWNISSPKFLFEL